MWLITTERQWLIRKLFSQEPHKKAAWMVLWSNFTTSLQAVYIYTKLQGPWEAFGALAEMASVFCTLFMSIRQKKSGIQ